MDEIEPLGDQFPFIEGRVMGVEEETRMLKYKLWITLIRLTESSSCDSVDDGADFAFDIETEINKLERELLDE
tara:strand:- start:503 stop:721 length:219 start_codon:yes stop_codon:yes gene_type:complete